MLARVGGELPASCSAISAAALRNSGATSDMGSSSMSMGVQAPCRRLAVRQYVVRPPEVSNVAPVVKLHSSLAMKQIIAALS